MTENAVSAAVTGAGAAAATSAAPPAGSESLGPALSDEIDSFWHSGPALSDLHVNPFAVEATDALLRQLGPAPVDVGGENLVELLTPVYRALAEQAERQTQLLSRLKLATETAGISIWEKDLVTGELLNDGSLLQSLLLTWPEQFITALGSLGA